MASQSQALAISAPRKSAWSVFTAWLATSFSSEDSDSSGDADSHGKNTPRRKSAGTNGFSPSTNGHTSPSPVRKTPQQQNLTSSARPAFVRASTLRTIDEGDSPYGSYISSSVPSLRHIAALSGASPTVGSLEGAQSGSGIVARRSVSGNSSRRGSAELGMLMIEERREGADKGKGKERASDSDEGGAVSSESPVKRCRSRSRSRSHSPLTTQQKPGKQPSRFRQAAMPTPERIDKDDPDDPFQEQSIPSHRTAQEGDEKQVDESTPLVGSSSRSSTTAPNPSSTHSSSYSSVPDQSSTPDPWYRGPLFEAGWKLGVLFAIFTVIMVGGIYLGLPKIDPEDRPALKLPRSFADLQALNGIFQKYKDRYPLRVMIVGCASYLYVQAFILPGSMYISILFGAAYGVLIGAVLSCICEATGALLNYTLSAVVGPPLLTIESYRNRLELWRVKIMGDAEKGEQVGWDGVFSFLIVLRIAPFPPHWIANIVAPHLGINPLLFWSAAFIGIAPVSVIHTTIGSGLDSMTSAEDFHILSLRNVLGLLGIAVAVMIPTGLKRFFKKDLSGLSEAEAALHNPDIQIQAASINGDEASLSASRHSFGEPYYASDAISYQSHDAGAVLSPSAGYGPRGEGYYFGSQKTGKGPRAMDLEEALSVIENEEDHEVLAVVYEGDAEADSIIEEFATSALHQDHESTSETDQNEEGRDEEGKEVGWDGVASSGRDSPHRGYGTIPHGDVEQGGRGSPRVGDAKPRWQLWKR